MNAFKLIPREYFKLLLELVVIFLSVVLAFFFDDYRENRSQREQYKADLISLARDIRGVRGDIHTHLDSFRVEDDTGQRGKRLRQLLHLLWLDSLVDQQKATMRDFRFIIASHCLEPFGDWKVSPLANEIRIKYSSQVSEYVLASLSRYQEEMADVNKGNTEAIEELKTLNTFIHKISPDLEFSKQDSLWLYSNEVRWSLKQFIAIQRDLYRFEKYLAQGSLMDIGTHITKELLTLGVETFHNPDCHGTDFKKRYECENGKSIRDEDIIKIKDDVISERNMYFNKLRK